MNQYKMTDKERELVSNYIERYAFSEERGQYSFVFMETRFKFQNYAIPMNYSSRMLIYLKLRSILDDVFTGMRNAIDMNDNEIWVKWFNRLPDIYEPFVGFTLMGENQYNSFFNKLAQFFQKVKNEDKEFNKILETMMDIVGMSDHSVSYGVYLIGEFKRLLENKDNEALIENKDRFPFILKEFKSQKEANIYLKSIDEKFSEENQDENSNDLQNMDIIGRA